MPERVVYLILLCIAVMAAWGQYFLKSGLASAQTGPSLASFTQMLPKLVTSPSVVGASILYAGALLAYMFLLSKMEVTRLLPLVLGISFGLVTLISWRLLGESISLPRILGMGAILLGVVLIARS